VCAIDKEIILNAQNHQLHSFETGIQVECANRYQLDAIITIRYRDFLESKFINFFSPKEFIESYSAAKQEPNDINTVKAKINHALALSFLKENNAEKEKIILFQGWEIEYFDLTCSRSSLTNATVVLINNQSKNKQYRYSESAFGVGAINTLFSAFDKVIRHIVERSNHILDSIKVSNTEKSVEGSVKADLIVIADKHRIHKFCVHRNIVKACFYAYIEAIKEAYDQSQKNAYSLPIELSPTIKVSDSDVLEKYNFGERNFVKTNLEHTNLVGVNLSAIDLSFSSLSYSNLERINLSEANLTKVFLKKATVTNANLSKAILYKAKLNNSVLRDSRLDYVELIKADLTGAILTNADLSHADLTGAILTNADLSHADLTGAILTNADLSHADLTGAILTDVNLSNGNLTSANFTNTLVNGANFSEANLSYTNLTDLDLNKTVFCKPVLTDTAMPQIKIEIYGRKRIEGITLLFSQFESNHYKIFAVCSNAYSAWWNNEMRNKFRQVNRELREKGIPIKRVFIIPEDNFDDEMKAIIKEQADLGIEVRCLPEKDAADVDGFDLRKTNFLVCENISVEDNSFTTMMIFDENKNEETSGYISFKKYDLKVNQERFNMIWNKAETYSLNICGSGTKASC
jgi:uncharacterized protein YjbI with pentapeptide repeats